MIVVGIVFLCTGMVKAVNAAPFLRQIDQYRVLPPSISAYAGLAFIGIEWAIGTALLFRVSVLLMPAVIALLLILTVLTIWGRSTGRVEDCGCYGGLLFLTPMQGLALNCAYILLLAIAWFSPIRAVESWGRWGLVLAAFVAGSAVSLLSLRKPLFQFSPVKVGKRWSKRWLKDAPRATAQGSHFLVFLTKDCPYCKRWVPLLNVIEVQRDLPQVMGIMSLTGAERDEFLAQHLIHFPVTYMHHGLMSLLVDSYPTAALVEEGTIVQKWVGEMPSGYVERIRQFYDAITPKEARHGTFAG
jgi:hypothetical protein